MAHPIRLMIMKVLKFPNFEYRGIRGCHQSNQIEYSKLIYFHI